MSSLLDQKLTRMFDDITDNTSSDADPETMAMQVSKLCRFVTFIGGREVPDICAELDRFSELLPYYSMLETLRVSMRRLTADTIPQDSHLLGPLVSSRKDAPTGNLQHLHVAYTVQYPPQQDASVLRDLFAQTYAVIQNQMVTRPVNVLLLLDFAVKQGKALGLDVREEDMDGSLNEDRNLLRFFQNSTADEEDGETPSPATGGPAPTAPQKPADAPVQPDPDEDAEPRPF